MGNGKIWHLGFEPLLVRPKKVIKPPSMYSVVMYNDDYTPMDFVVEVLKHFFNMQHDKAIDTMLQIHHTGRAVCGIYTKDIAKTKVIEVERFMHSYEYPLLLNIEVL